jgi:branched-chain amino acid transport system permease protein
LATYIVTGLVVGSVYAIATLGLVLTYSSTRIFNFAHGALAYFCAITFYELSVEHGWHPRLAGAVTVFVVSPLLGLFLWAVLFRALADTAPSVRLVSTIGLFVAVPALTRAVFGHDERFERPSVVWEPAHQYRVLDVGVDSDQVAVIAAAALIALTMTALVRWTPFGLSIRATVDAPRMAGIVGINAPFVSAGAWMVGTTLAGVAGVLLGTYRGFDELQFTFLVLGSFAAVVIARMHSLPLAFAGSLLLGVVQELSKSVQVRDFLTDFVDADSVLIRGLPASIPFLVMIVFLLAYRGLGREQFAVDRRAGDAPAPGDATGPLPRWRRRLPLALALAAVLVAPVFLSGLWEGIVAKGLALAIAFCSFTVVTGEGGMISLAQITFAGIAAAVTADFATNQGMAVLVAIPLAALIVVPIGVLAALPSLRLGDLYLALATLAFALLVQNTYFQRTDVSNFGDGVRVPRPQGFGDDTAFYYLLVALFVVVALLVRNLKRSTTGLDLSAMRASEAAAATLGISIVWSKLAAFGISAFIAGVGGGLYATYGGAADPDQYVALVGVVWLAVVVTWGVRSITGALLAGLAFAAFPQLIVEHLSGSETWRGLPTILFGLGAIGLAREPRGIVYQVVYGHRARRHRRAARRAAAGAAA